jgi:hypothetical protein
MLTALFEQIVNGTMIGSIYVLVALGMVLIFGVMQVLNFAHGVLFMTGGYLCHFAFFHLTGSYPASIVLSMLALGLLGLLQRSGRCRACRQRAVEAGHELAGDAVVDRPQAGHHMRRAGQQEGAHQANPLVATRLAAGRLAGA